MRVPFRPVLWAVCLLGSLITSGCSLVENNYADLSVPVHAYEVQPSRLDNLPSQVSAAPGGRDVRPSPVSARPAGLRLPVDLRPVSGEPSAELSGELAFAFDPPVPTRRGMSEGLTARLFVTDPMAELAALRESRALQDVPREVRGLSAKWSLSAPAAQTGFGFDVKVTPRVSFSQDGDLAVRRIGGEVRIRRAFDQRGNNSVIRSWSLFAGADGEALVWEPDLGGRMSVNGMALRDRATVGDLHAGIAFQSGLGQLALSYIRREVEYRDRALRASETEDFAGLTFSLRR